MAFEGRRWQHCFITNEPDLGCRDSHVRNGPSVIARHVYRDLCSEVLTARLGIHSSVVTYACLHSTFKDLGSIPSTGNMVLAALKRETHLSLSEGDRLGRLRLIQVLDYSMEIKEAKRK